MLMSEKPENKDFFQTVFGMVRQILADAPGCHDFDHTLRVLNNARLILETEKVSDPFAVELAALLHDVARPDELGSDGKICHAKKGESKSEDIMRKAGCSDEKLIKAVSLAVRRHRYRSDDKPQNDIEKVVYDADKLDSIGAVGIGRAFHFAGRIGARLHNTENEAVNSPSYSREDSAYREYLVKLRHVPERMLTESGRRLAAERAEFMHEFFDRMNSES